LLEVGYVEEAGDAKRLVLRVGDGGGGMKGRTVAAVVLVVGVLMFLIAAAADGIGLGGAPGFGWKQIVGVAAGVLMAAVGIVGLRSSRA
jgi:hypothetical protein